MGFFGKLKQMAGVGGVKLQLLPDGNALIRGGGSLTGNIELTSKTDQQITSIVVKVQEVITVYEGNQNREREYDLGVAEVCGQLEIKAGESKMVPFAVTYSGGRTLSDQLQAQGGALGVMGKIGAIASNEKLQYRLHAHAKVVGTAFGSGAHIQLAPTNG